MHFKTFGLAGLLLFLWLAAGCGSSNQAPASPGLTPAMTSTAAAGVTPTPLPTQSTTVTASSQSTQQHIPTVTPPVIASALTSPPVNTSVNTMHPSLINENTEIRFGTHADPNAITLGPTSGGPPGYDSYPLKNSMNIKMPDLTPVLAPIDMTFIGFANRNAEFRDDNGDVQRPFDDLELCFRSDSQHWPGMVVCVYHLSTSPFLLGHNQSPRCAAVERWDPLGPGQAAGWLYFEDNDSFYAPDGSASPNARDATPCQGRLGA